MSWTRAELKRSYPCNAELIKFLREQKKWSQKQLAKESGYCERLAAATIEVLAKTLSSKSMQVHPEDLISDPIALSKKFIEAAHTLQEDMVKGIAHFTDPKGEFNFVRTTAKGDFAGSHKGIKEFAMAVHNFFEAQSFVKGQDFQQNYNYYGDGNDVVAWGTSMIQYVDTGETDIINVTLRLLFSKGKLRRIDDRSELS